MELRTSNNIDDKRSRKKQGTLDKTSDNSRKHRTNHAKQNHERGIRATSPLHQNCYLRGTSEAIYQVNSKFQFMLKLFRWKQFAFNREKGIIMIQKGI